MVNVEAVFDTKRLTKMVDVEFGLSELGTLAHFLVERARLKI